jgi:hypothetical protein
MLSIGAGTGLLYLLRWFWWRISAWSEIAAMVSSFVVAVGLAIAQRNGLRLPGGTALLLAVAITTTVWLAVTFLAPQTRREALERFYRTVRPAGPGWAHIRHATGLPASPDALPQALLGWVLGVACVYGALFGVGSWLFGHTTLAAVWLTIMTVCAVGLYRLLPALWSGTR